MKYLPRLSSLRDKLVSRIVEETVRAPFEPILHTSTTRLKYIGIFALLGQPFFGWLWTYAIPQPYENLPARICVALLGLVLTSKHYTARPEAFRTQWVFNLIMWIELPLLFMWLYTMNTGNVAWFSSVVVMIVLYYQMVDWRLATGGLIAAAAAVYGGQEAWGSVNWQDFKLPSDQKVVLLFATSSAFTLAVSSANLRRKRLEDSLATMAIVAHELRTPLATLSMLGDALRNESKLQSDESESERLDNLATRIYSLSRSMNQQIDTQIANTSLLHLSSPKEPLLASDIVGSALTQYPFRGHREKQVITVNKINDFSFESSGRLFTQVMINLLQNAFRAVAATQRQAKPGDIHIEIDQRDNRGYFKVIDQGTGIRAELLNQIFEPFFSTQTETGHGLGLAFCRRVVTASSGRIHVQSSPGKGTTFTIELRLKSK
jgi:two-component system, CAI-1 autoinducer sensor kinase/phosphatase CqsS